MKFRLPGFLLALCCLATAQQPTRIGQHEIGETLSTWAAITHVLEDLPAACRGRDKDKVKCGYLTSIRDGKADKTFQLESDRSWLWEFSDGRLSVVTIKPNPIAARPKDRTLNFHDETDLLKQAYGAPIEKKIPMHNAFGVKWERTSMTWKMPDGTEIRAIEDPGLDTPGIVLKIEFLSKEALAVTSPYK